MQKHSLLLCTCLIVVSSVSVNAQVPIDLSQAKEFKLVWKMSLEGEAHAFSYLQEFGGKVNLNVLTTSIGGIRKHQTWATKPKLDTTNLFDWLGYNNAIHVRTLEYDGIPPFEYVNSKGIVWRCNTISNPFPLTPIDTVACSGEPVESVDIDSDGFIDILTDIGGGGVTTRIIMGGPQAGDGCERVLVIPKVKGGNDLNTTMAFWRTTNGKWRLVQAEQDSNAQSPWLVIYDVLIARENNELKATFIQTDSLYGNGIDKTDIPIGDCIGIADTLAKRDWLLVMRRLDDSQRTWVLERFDATNGKFESTGEQVTGVEFYEPWNAGYTLGINKPVVAFHATDVGRVFCAADNLRQPFALWFPKGAIQPPVSGMIAINDQTGDGIPDVVAAGGGSNGTMALYTLDSTSTSVNDRNVLVPVASGKMIGEVLELTLPTPVVVSAQLVTTDGRVFQVVPPVQGIVGVNRFDLAAMLRMRPTGAYILRVRCGESLLNIKLLR